MLNQEVVEKNIFDAIKTLNHVFSLHINKWKLENNTVFFYEDEKEVFKLPLHSVMNEDF